MWPIAQNPGEPLHRIPVPSPTICFKTMQQLGSPYKNLGSGTLQCGTTGDAGAPKHQCCSHNCDEKEKHVNHWKNLVSP